MLWSTALPEVPELGIPRYKEQNVGSQGSTVLMNGVHISTPSHPSSFPSLHPSSFLSPSPGTLHALSPTTQPTPPPAPPPLITNCTFHQPQTSVTGSGPSKSKLLRSSSGKRGRSSPTLNSQKKSQYVLVAAEAMPLTAAGNSCIVTRGGHLYLSCWSVCSWDQGYCRPLNSHSTTVRWFQLWSHQAEASFLTVYCPWAWQTYLVTWQEANIP